MFSSRTPDENQESDGREWLMTYADMITLLLVFFILMLAMSTMDLPRFEEALKSIKKAINKQTQPHQRQTPSKVMSQVVGIRQRNLINEINRALDGTPEGVAISAQFDKNKILLTVQDNAVFAPGQAKLLKGGEKVLDGVAKVLRTFPEYNINIRGHTDSQPIRSSQFPSNWELSAIRATACLRYLITRGIKPYKMTATGLSDIDPVAPNDTKENMALNRRVEFVLEKKR